MNLRRMRQHRLKQLIKKSAIIAGIVLLMSVIGIVAQSMTENNFLAQTLAYADEAPAIQTPVVTPVAVPSDIHFELKDIVWEGETAWVNLTDGRRAKLTLRKDLMDTIHKSLYEHPVPYGGGVAIDPPTGRVLAISSASTAKPTIENYAIKAMAPSASVFKLVTAAALLEKNAVDPDANVCYPPGGEGGLNESHIRGTTNLTTCNSLRTAIARSINPVLARLAYQHLTREDLERIAYKFGFNREIPFEVQVDVSNAEFVEDDIERAKTAAGFWHVNLSPFHGALLASAIINNGVMMRPTLVDSIYDAQGNLVYTMEPQPWSAVMTMPHAQTLAKMGESTTAIGTARNIFAARKGWKKGVVAGGKTGTLSNKKPAYTFNWYVGWASLGESNLAVGALVVNTDKWWIKGTHVAARTTGAFFHE